MSSHIRGGGYIVMFHHFRGGGHIVSGADPVGVGIDLCVGIALSCLHNIL